MPKDEEAKIKKRISNDMHGFLETNTERLEKVSQLFGDKIKSVERYSQTETLIARQKEVNNKLKTALTDNFVDPNSQANRNIAHIFNKFFGRKS